MHDNKIAARKERRVAIPGGKSQFNSYYLVASLDANASHEFKAAAAKKRVRLLAIVETTHIPPCDDWHKRS
jgi:hypothetical protein